MMDSDGDETIEGKTSDEDAVVCKSKTLSYAVE